MVGVYENINDFRVNNGCVTSADGTTIGYIQAGNGPSLVIVHGSLQCSADWTRALPHLAKHFTCYVMDRRGRGNSGDSEEYSLNKEYEDLKAVLEIAGSDAFVFGHSYGGICALETARTLPISKLAIYEPPLPAYKSVTAHALEAYKKAVATAKNEQVLITGLTHFLRMNEDSLSIFRNSKGWQKSIDLTPTWTREIHVIDELEMGVKRFSSIKSPTLLLSSSNSLKHHVEPVEALHGTLPNATRVTIPDQGHNAHLTAPALLSEIISDFLLT